MNKICSFIAAITLSASAMAEGGYIGTTFSSVDIDYGSGGSYNPGVLSVKGGAHLNDNIAIELRVGTGVISADAGTVVMDVDKIVSTFLVLTPEKDFPIYAMIGRTTASATINSSYQGSSSGSESDISYGLGVNFKPKDARTGINFEAIKYANKESFTASSINIGVQIEF